MLQDRFIYLATRKMALDISREEEMELAETLKQAHYQKAWEWMQQFWEQKETAPSPDLDAALQKTLALINEPEEQASNPPFKKGRRKIAWLMAAGVVILLILAGYFLQQEKGKEIVSQEILQQQKRPGTGSTDTTMVLEKHNTKGTRSLITLPDGTTVWLNADSKLSYPQAFAGNTREVALTGEAFFDVVKNKNRPFIIHLNKGSLKVLGTSFNVKAYEGDETIETSVVTGKVAFIPRNDSFPEATDTTFITPDMKAIYAIETGTVTTVPTFAKEDKDWTEGRLVFKNVTLKEIADVLNRHFGKEVVFGKEEMANYRLTGSFANNTLEEILYYLSRSKPFTYRITETQILLYAIE